MIPQELLGYEVDNTLEQSIAVARANRDTWNEVLALFHRALLAEAEGDAEQVAHFCRTWLVLASSIVIVNGSSIAYCLEGLAVAAAITGQLDRAARLFGATDALRSIAGSFMLTPQQTEYAHTVTSLRQALLTPELAPAWAEGRALNMVEAVEHALETYGTP